ncbi:MAG: hypothetical protein HC890_10050 [Chloroflexaceae bacterium]|nr:hypothetical protein [Chloroflexaceae bacterium]
MRINKLKSAVSIGSALSLLAIATVPAIAESPQQENLVSQLPGQETSPQAEEEQEEPMRVGKYILGETINQDGGIIFVKVPGEDGTVIVSGSVPLNSTVLLTRNDEGKYEFEGPANPPLVDDAD